MASNEHQESIKKVAELIKDIEIAMLTTVEQDGSLRSRPMQTQKVEFDGEIYFFTKASSPKADEVENESNVCVAYAKPDDNLYVSVSGKGRVSRDKQKMEELWNPVLKAWFPKGLEDPDIALLIIRAEKAEYWEGPSNTIVLLAGMVKAFVTGNQDIGEHEKISL